MALQWCHMAQSVPQTTDPMALIEEIRSGLPVSALEDLVKLLDLTREETGQLLGLSVRTLSRLHARRTLDPVASDRLARVSQLVDHATDTLGGADMAAGWFRDPNPGLGGVHPIELLDTDVGVEMVDAVLRSIDYGIYG